MPESFDSRERSGALSQPIEYYDFFRVDASATVHWRYVSAAETLSFAGAFWGALPGLSRSDIQQKGETSSMQVTVTVPRDCEVALALRGQCSTNPVELIITRAQRGLADGLAEEMFRGEVTDPVFEGSVAALTCSSEESAWGDTLCRLAYSRTCPHMFTDTLCGVAVASVTFPGVITALSTDRLTVTVDEVAPPVDHLAGGSLFYQMGCIAAGAQLAFVTQQVGHVLTLQTPFWNAVVGDAVALIAGCDRTPAGCTAHANIARFGGFALIPVINPWAGLT